MLKNQVTDVAGWRGYTLFTQPVLDNRQADQSIYLQHCEAFEHLGEVDAFVVNMYTRYRLHPPG